ncbi:MAG: PorV/PorQ family protein [candidate division FCPU426 bacterium]
MRRQIGLIVCLVLLTPAAGFAGLTSGARIMEYPANARAFGLAEAFSALADDAAAIHYNPAGLYAVPSYQVNTAFQKGLYDTFYSHLGFAMPLNNQAGLGVAVSYLNGGTMDLTFIDGTERQVTAQQDFLWALACGLQVSGENTVGLSVKILQSTLAEEYRALGFACDGGLKYKVMDDLTFALVIKNLGPNLTYDQGSDPLPTSVTAGCGYRYVLAPEHRFQAALDLKKPLDLSYQLHAGVEYEFDRMFFLRAGYKYGHDLDGFTFGAGMEWAFFRLDYAAGLMSELGMNHYISVLFTF